MSRHVAVTGASSGLGEAFAREFGAHGDRITLVARRGDVLERIAAAIGGETHVAVHDLSEPEHAAEWVGPAERALGPVDVLINAAGVQVIAPLDRIDAAQAGAMLRVNLEAPLRLIRAVLPGQVRRGRGSVVNVASVGALAPPPWMNYYNATKAGLAAFSESLRAEVAGTGVNVLTVYPGPMRTPMAAYGLEVYGNALSARIMPMGSPGKLARVVRRAVERRRARVIYPRLYRFMRWFPSGTRFFLDRFAPRPVDV